MRIVNLTTDGISPAVAEVYRSKQGKRYYNLRHGTRGHGLWCWHAGLDQAFFPVDKPTIQLDADNYILEPVYTKTGVVTDDKGNQSYLISVNTDKSHVNDVVVLLDIPRTRLKDLDLKLTGSVTMIGVGVAGKVKSNKEDLITVPANVLEVDGDCTISWSGITTTGDVMTLTAHYIHTSKTWEIHHEPNPRG